MVYYGKNLNELGLTPILICSFRGISIQYVFKPKNYAYYKKELVFSPDIVGYTCFSKAHDSDYKRLRIKNNQFSIYENAKNKVFGFLSVGNNSYVVIESKSKLSHIFGIFWT